jgi:hypothetical protein
MIDARCREQGCLGKGAEFLGLPRENDFAQTLGFRRAARLPRRHHILAVRTKPSRQKLDLRGFARTIAAFEGDETSGTGYGIRHWAAASR